MRKILSGALITLALLTAACGGDDDDKSIGDITGEDDKGDKGDDPKPTGDEAEYVKAIADVSQETDGSDDLPMSPRLATCYGTAFVDVVGVDTLKDKVTPDEIRDDPSKDHVDWGITLSEDDGREIFRDMVDCDPDFMQELGDAMTESMNEDGDFTDSVEPGCFADTDPDDVEDFFAAALAGGDDAEPNEEQAAALIEWMGTCIDFKAAIIASITADSEIPDGVGDCLDEKIDEDLIKDFMAASAAAGDDGDVEDSPEGQAFTAAMTECMTGG